MDYNSQLTYEKGKVVEINNDYAIVMTETFQFVKVAIRGKMRVGQSIFFTSIDVITENRKKTQSQFWLAKGIAAVLVLALIIHSMTNMGHHQVYAAVSLDINPSLVFEIDETYKVLNYQSYNEEGETFLTDDFIGEDISDVLNEVLEKAQEDGYLNENKNTILIASTLMDDDVIENAPDLLEEHVVKQLHSEEVNLNVVVIESSKEDYEQSKTEAISLGRYGIEQKLFNGEEKADENIDDLFEEGFFNDENTIDADDVSIVKKEKSKENDSQKEEHSDSNKKDNHSNTERQNEEKFKEEKEKSKNQEDVLEKSNPQVEKINEYQDKRDDKYDKHDDKYDGKHDKHEDKQDKRDEKQDKRDEKQDKRDEKQDKRDEKHEKRDEKHDKRDEKHEKLDEKHEKLDEKHEKLDEKHEKRDEKHEKRDEKQDKHDDKQKKHDEKAIEYYKPKSIKIEFDNNDLKIC